MRAGSAGAVHVQDGVAHHARGVAIGFPQCPVVNSQFREDLTRPELEVLQDEVPLVWCWILRCRDERKRQRHECETDEPVQHVEC